MTENSFVGIVKRKCKPKIYQTPWGVNRRFFVQFIDGQKAMFAAAHEDTFKSGDQILIQGANITDGWMSVTENDTIVVQKAFIPEDYTITAETGYVTKTKTDKEGNEYFLCYFFTVTTRPDGMPDFRLMKFPADVVWQEDNHPSPPSYSNITVSGHLEKDAFIVHEILGEVPIQRHETIVVKVSDLKYHRWGADFIFTFGNEEFKGTISTPFFSSPIYNVVCEHWDGSVEVSGVWIKRGRIHKVDGEWRDEKWWELWKGKNRWETSAINTVKSSVRIYESIDGFVDLMEKITEPKSLISYEEVSKLFKKIGYDVSESQVRLFLWHQDLDDFYINYLMKLTSKMFQTPNDEFFFYFPPNEQRSTGMILCEVPKERYSTMVIRVIDGKWEEQISEIVFRGRDQVILNPDTWPKLGVVRTVKHDNDWETKILMALAEG